MRNMTGNIHEFDGLRVRVDDVVYMPGLDAQWVVRENDGEVTVVEGDGVVGQTPVIDPGGHFSYNSYHVVAGDAQVEGAFFGEASGEWIYTRIPSFRLHVPEWV